MFRLLVILMTSHLSGLKLISQSFSHFWSLSRSSCNVIVSALLLQAVICKDVQWRYAYLLQHKP